MKKSIKEQCKRRGCQVNYLEAAAVERTLRPLEPDMIVKREQAFLMLDLLRRYNLLIDNCEHFATFCQYEKGFSQQVQNCRWGSG